MKIFISQPMMNKPNDMLQMERARLVHELEAQGYEVIDTILDLGSDATPLQYLAESIKLIDKADGVVFMKDWDMSRGCVIEYEVAMRYGKFVKIL